MPNTHKTVKCQSCGNPTDPGDIENGICPSCGQDTSDRSEYGDDLYGRGFGWDQVDQ